MDFRNQNNQRFKEAGILVAFLLLLFSFSNRSFAKTNEDSKHSRIDHHITNKTSATLPGLTQAFCPVKNSIITKTFCSAYFESLLIVHNHKISTQIRTILAQELPKDFRSAKFRKSIFAEEDEDPAV